MTMQSNATLDDGATAPALSVLSRLKLSRELATIKTDIAAIAAGPMAALTRLKLVARANQIRAQLGGAISPPVAPPVAPVVVEPEPAPAPAPAAESEAPEVGELRDVVAGKHDGLGLDGLLAKIDKAARALFDAGSLLGDIEALAHEAVSHWARLELQTNG